MEEQFSDRGVDPVWAVRPALLALIGLAAGLLAHFTIGDAPIYRISSTQVALLSFVVVAPTVFGFVVERARFVQSLVFAGVCGVVAALILYFNGPVETWSASEGWRAFCVVLTLGIAAPLFQGAETRGYAPWRARYPYAPVHEHAWINAVLFAASCVFVGIVFAMLWMLASLLDLIGLDFLKTLLRHDWFWRATVGLAFGGGLGLLREQGRVVQLLQRAVTSVLGVLAPALAAGLALFLLALPFTGLSALWDAWMSAAGLMLACAVAALLLANAVIGNDSADESRNIVLRAGATVLAVVILPLAILASVAIGMRIDQYGFTPDRLWALTFAAIASAFGLAYLVEVVRGRRAWPDLVRPTNVRLATALCIVALVLATPIASFNAIATRDQVARLQSGRISAAKFDWAALRYDFGDPGRAAIDRLAKDRNAEVRRFARAANRSEHRWQMSSDQTALAAVPSLDERLRVLPAGAAVPGALRNQLTGYDLCGAGDEACTVMMLGPGDAVVLKGGCWDQRDAQSKSSPVAAPAFSIGCGNPTHVALRGGKWSADGVYGAQRTVDAETRGKARDGFARGNIEVRKVERRQVFVGGVPVGDTFE